MGRLTAKFIEKAKAGRHSDGDGLILHVRPTGGKSWILRVQYDGVRRDIGLGSASKTDKPLALLDDVPILEKRVLTLAEARLKAGTLRQFAKAGRNPVAELKRDRSPIPCFADAARQTHKAKLGQWSDKTAKAFLSSLERHAFGRIGSTLVNEIDARQIADALMPIWLSTPLMARKVRQRIGLVLNFAQAERWREVGMPNDALGLLLPRQSEGGNFGALHYKDVPAFVTSMREGESIGRLALLFLIFTVARSGEVRGARWSQIDKLEKIWLRPPELMKGRNARSHAVTLNDAALQVLELAGHYRRNDTDLIFPSRKGVLLSDMALSSFMEGMKATPHGFRSSYRDWAAEKMPSIPDPVAEAALAHKVPDKVIAAYKRTAFVEMRRELLDGWGRYCNECEVRGD